MKTRLEKLLVSNLSTVWCALVGLTLLAGLPLLASTPSFLIPEDTALRIRLDDTLTSVDSQVGDPVQCHRR